MIYKEEMSMFFDEVEWETEFLRTNIKFMGQSPSNNITGLSLWSGALRAEDITSLYDCKQEHSHADILSWEDVEFDVSPETSKIQILESENEEEPCKDQVDFFYISPVLSGMDNKKEASRKCFALGGKMDVFVNENDLKDFNHECGPWAPAFRSGGRWVDNSNNEVKYLPWAENEPTYPDKFRCVTINDKKYIADDCSLKTCFYCKMKSYGLFRLR